jgi:anthranilate phosphoribosyltransferase
MNTDITIKQAIDRVASGSDLSRSETRSVFDRIMSGDASPAQISSLITAMRMKGETNEEIQGAASSMRAAALDVEYPDDDALLDIVGTGGDEKNTFNVSTTSSFVAAGAGCVVAKHGNRSVSSSSGSADVLETLGINIDTNAEQNEQILSQAQIAFLFAPAHHPAMKHAIGPRKEIGIRTIFNILGPITNPASADHYLLGAYSESVAEKLAHALAGLNTEHALVVHGSGYDEATLTGPTTVFHVENKTVNRDRITPDQFGLDPCEEGELTVEGPQESAETIQGIFDGSIRDARRRMIELNAGLAIYASRKADTMQEGIERAKESIESGAAADALARLADASQSVE